MKKLLVGLLTLTSLSAFAQRHMVTLEGYEDDRSDNTRSLDLYRSHGGNSGSGNHENTTSYAFNYAFAITGAWQAGALYRNVEEEVSDTDSETWGVFGIYNFSHQVTDTHYLALKYEMQENEAAANKSETDTWSLEFGHRFTLGTIWSMNYSWSPSLELAFAKTDPKSGDDYGMTTWKLNVLKVDVLF